MCVNKLKLNDLKTEFLLLRSPYQNDVNTLHQINLQTGEATIIQSVSARNLGVVFDSHLNFHKQISQVVSSAFFYLRKIASVKKYIPSHLLSNLIHAFITSRLDFCNSLYYGIPDCELYRLQKILNQAARLLTGASKHQHITPILYQLHWLPVEHRITYKILTFAFQSCDGRRARLSPAST